MQHTIITGHSGFENTGRDSIETVVKGVEMGLECVEVDVRMDAQGSLRLSHDCRSSYEGAASLREAMCLIAASDTCLNCDLKEPRTLYPVLALAKECGVREGRLIFSGSVPCDLLAADESISREARIFLNIEEIAKYMYAGQSGDFADLLRTPWSQLYEAFGCFDDQMLGKIYRAAESVGAETINLPKKLPYEMLTKLRSLGAELSIWTVNEEEELKRMLKLEPLNITTMQPGIALRIRDGAAR